MNCQRDLDLGNTEMTNQIGLLVQLTEVGEEEGNEKALLCSYHSRAGVYHVCYLRPDCATEVLTLTKTSPLLIGINAWCEPI